MSKDSFSSLLRVINIDEAHCINICEGSFRPDYASLGVLQARFPQNVPLQIAPPTLPEHVLDDIRSKLRLAQDVKMVRVTNACRAFCPNNAVCMYNSDDPRAEPTKFTGVLTSVGSGCNGVRKMSRGTCGVRASV